MILKLRKPILALLFFIILISSIMSDIFIIYVSQPVNNLTVLLITIFFFLGAAFTGILTRIDYRDEGYGRIRGTLEFSHIIFALLTTLFYLLLKQEFPNSYTFGFLISVIPFVFYIFLRFRLNSKDIKMYGLKYFPAMNIEEKIKVASIVFIIFFMLAFDLRGRNICFRLSARSLLGGKDKMLCLSLVEIPKLKVLQGNLK